MTERIECVYGSGRNRDAVRWLDVSSGRVYKEPSGGLAVNTGFRPDGNGAYSDGNVTLAAVVQATAEPQPKLSPTEPQPAPVANNSPAAWGLVMKDMVDRDQFGREKYGVPLQPGNGRDALADAYQEALDLAVYLRTAIYERDGK